MTVVTQMLHGRKAAGTLPPQPVGVGTFMLLQADPGYAPALAAAVSQLSGVLSAAQTAGAYDVVVELDDVGTEQLDEVRAAIRRAPGLCRLCVCRGPAEQALAS